MKPKTIPFLPISHKAAAPILKGLYPAASVVTKIFPMLGAELDESGNETPAIDYAAGAVLVFVFYFVFMVTFSSIIILVRLPPDAAATARPISFLFSAFFSFAAAFYCLIVPRWEASKRMREIDRDLLFATRHLMIQTSAGVPLFDAIVSASEDLEGEGLSYGRHDVRYGEVGRAFAQIVLQVRSGTELTTALEQSAAMSPSQNFRKVVWQLSNANKTGVRVGNVLRETVEFLASDQMITIRSYGAQLSTLALFYMLGCIIAPSMGIVVLAIGANILPSLPLNEWTFGLILVMLIIVQAFFVGLIKSRRPTVSL